MFQGVAFEFVRRAVHRPEPHGSAVAAVNELAVFGDDLTVLAGEFFVQVAKVDHGIRGEGVCLGREIEPTAPFRGSGRGSQRRPQQKEPPAGEEQAVFMPGGARGGRAFRQRGSW